jgi:hypothetical protein
LIGDSFKKQSMHATSERLAAWIVARFSPSGFRLVVSNSATNITSNGDYSIQVAKLQCNH